MLELTVLLTGVVVILIFLYLYDNIVLLPTESFENYYLSSCPSGYKSFYNIDGDIICCDGEVVANKCISDNQCTLNGKGTDDMPNCVKLILKMYAEKSKSQCSPSFPSYFENKDKNIKGCTNGLLNDSLNGPQHHTQPQCNIYPTLDLNTNSKDSCFNQKQLDNVQCFGNNCTKEVVQPIANAPALIAIGFTDNTGMHRVAYTQQSMENYLNVSNPNWRNQGLDLTKNINVAQVAKAYYVDKTMNQADVQF